MPLSEISPPARPQREPGQWTPGRQALLLAVACWVLLAVSCAPDSAPREVDGRIVLTYWDKWSGAEQEAVEAVIERFNASQDRYVVEYEPITDIRNRLLLATLGGNPPDVAGLFPENLSKYAERGAILPLDHFMERDGISPDDYLPSVIEVCRRHGSHFALPTTPVSLALHYNRRLFEEAGLNPDRPPRTLGELDEYARRLTRYDDEGRIVQLGFSPINPPWFNHWWIWWFGGDHWDGERTITLDTPANLAAFRWLRSYPDRYGREALARFDASGGPFASARNLFIDERIAMQLQGVWMSGFIEAYNPDLDWAAAPFPAYRADLGEVTFVDTDVIVIPRGARDPEASWEFIRFMQQQENLELLSRAQRKFSPLREVSAEFYRDHPNPQIELFRYLAESPAARHTPPIPIMDELREEMNLAVQRVWLGAESPREVLVSTEEKLQRLLDRSLRQWERIRETHETLVAEDSQ